MSAFAMKLGMKMKAAMVSVISVAFRTTSTGDSRVTSTGAVRIRG